jgi:hypothetical protein
MLELIIKNMDKVLIVTGAVVVLFWPKIKAAIAAAGTAPAPSPSCSSCPCCAPPKPEEPVSNWVNRQLEVREYCERRGLVDAVKACDVVITEMISGEPSHGHADKVASKKGC